MCLKKKKLDACMNTFRAASHRDDEAVLFKHAFISTNNDNDEPQRVLGVKPYPQPVFVYSTLKCVSWSLVFTFNYFGFYHDYLFTLHIRTCLFIKVYKGFSLYKSVLTSLISAPVPHVAPCSPEIFIVRHFIKNHTQPLRQQLLNNSWKSTSVLPHVFKSCTRIRR